jgi:hypothetical protein
LRTLNSGTALEAAARAGNYMRIRLFAPCETHSYNYLFMVPARI